MLKIPFDPKPASVLRFNARHALDHPVMRLEDCRPENVFDFQTGMRLMIFNEDCGGEYRLGVCAAMDPSRAASVLGRSAESLLTEAVQMWDMIRAPHWPHRLEPLWIKKDGASFTCRFMGGRVNPPVSNEVASATRKAFHVCETNQGHGGRSRRPQARTARTHRR